MSVIKFFEDLEGEIWKDICEIEGFEEFVGYQISNMGRVKSIKGAYEKLISQSENGQGYLKVGLHKNKKNKTIKTHRLVGLAFVPNDDKENKKELNHINEIKTDNRAENLEWCDRKYNINYGTRTEKVKKVKSKQVLCVELNKIFPSTMEIERQLGFAQSNISNCCNGRCNTAYGYHWEYVEEEEE